MAALWVEVTHAEGLDILPEVLDVFILSNIVTGGRTLRSTNLSREEQLFM